MSTVMWYPPFVNQTVKFPARLHRRSESNTVNLKLAESVILGQIAVHSWERFIPLNSMITNVFPRQHVGAVNQPVAFQDRVALGPPRAQPSS